eukprot:758810-Hanusia_phi.AAC.3
MMCRNSAIAHDMEERTREFDRQDIRTKRGAELNWSRASISSKTPHFFEQRVMPKVWYDSDLVVRY